MTFWRVTSSWVPLLSLIGKVAPSCPVLVPVGGALVPGPCVAAVLAWGVAGAPCLCAWCGGDAEHEATRRTVAVRAAAAPSAPAVFLLRVQAWRSISGLRRGVPGRGGAAR